MAYMPGTTHSVVSQTLKMGRYGYVNSTHSIPSPIIRPKHAPTTREGMKIPAAMSANNVTA
jgi:hypothetical protein